MAEEQKTSSLGERLLDSSCRVTLGPSPEGEDGMAEVWTNGLMIKPRFGRAIYIPFVEIQKIKPANYRIAVKTSAGSDVTVSQVGPKFDALAQKLVESWGDALSRALLMHEPVTVFEARANYTLRSGDSQLSGSCRGRIYQTSLVLLPTEDIPLRYPFSSIISAKLENYRITITSTDKETLELFRLGPLTDAFFEKLVGTQRELETSTIETIKTIIPSIKYEELYSLSAFMMEGRAAMRKDVERISSDSWRMLTNKVIESPMAEEFEYLSTISLPESTAIGLKKTINGVYVWFLVLIKGSSEQGGNSMIMEVTSETGHATYLFSVMSRYDFSANSQDFQREGEVMIGSMNEAMIATGFRREPIYLSDDQLNSETYSKYLFSSQNLPPLKLLRKRFFARVIHTTFENWKQDLLDALTFNTNAKDEGARWSKSQSEISEL